MSSQYDLKHHCPYCDHQWELEAGKGAIWDNYTPHVGTCKIPNCVCPECSGKYDLLFTILFRDVKTEAHNEAGGEQDKIKWLKKLVSQQKEFPHIQYCDGYGRKCDQDKVKSWLKEKAGGRSE